MEKIIKAIRNIQLTIGVLCLSIFFISVLIQILTRYLGISFLWTEELTNYSFIWAVFMGASVMVSFQEHFAFMGLYDKLEDPNKKKILKIIINATILIFSIYLLILGIEITKTFWNYKWISLPQLKRGYIWLSIPIMGGTMSLYSFYNILKEMKNSG
jgi:TRAP-type transport system small permease protein